MATKNAALRDFEANAKKAAWDQGANPNPSRIEITDASNNVLGTVNCSPIAMVAASGGSGQVTLAGLPITITASGTGTAAKARMISADGTYQITDLIVGMSNAHLIVDNTSWVSGQTFTLTAASFTTPATIANPT